MQICSNCHQSSIGGRYCTNCGSRLPDAIPAGVTSTLDTGRLRPIATDMLAPPPPPKILKPIGERREVTVLFLDITDFTRSVTQLDDEEAYILIDEVLQQLAALVAEFEGHVDKFTGDGMMALFGAPTAHENDAELAIRAALAMQKRLSQLSLPIQEKYGITMKARIGINTGTVIAGKVGGDVHMEYTVIGDTVNMASRLEQAAESGKILVSAATYQRARPIFHFQPMPPFQIKGKSKPVQAFEPISLRQKPGQVRGLPGMQAPMIGRQAPLETLRNELDLALNHKESRIAIITGEAGVGKSRLIAEFCQGLDNNIQVFEGGCLAYTRSRPYFVMAQMFRQIIGVNESSSPHKQHAALNAYLSEIGSQYGEHHPFLLHLLGLTHVDPAVAEQISQYDAGALHQLTQKAIREILQAEMGMAPTVLIFEDLHWIDDASRLVLQYFLQTLGEETALICFISRDVDTHIPQQLATSVPASFQSRVCRIQLTPLGLSDNFNLVKRLLRVDMPAGDKLLERIVITAEGNPFFTEELVRMLIDNGGITFSDNQWRIEPNAEQIMRDTPGTLHGLIMARFDQLPSPVRRILQKAAVLGDAFPLSLLQALCHTNNISSALQEVVARQFLTREPSSSYVQFNFHHILMQQAIYNTLLKRDRQGLHQRAAKAIEELKLGSEEDRSEKLAYHYARSEQPAQAIPHLIEAATCAQERYANETAIGHYRTAIGLLDQQGQTGDEIYIRAEIGLGQALKTLGHYRSAHAILQKVMQEILGWSLRSQFKEQLPIVTTGLLELADLAMREGDYDKALSHLDAGIEAIGDNGRQETPNLWRALIDQKAKTYLHLGQLDKAHALALSATNPIIGADKIQPAILARLKNSLAKISWHQGQINSAIDYVEQSLAIYHNLGYPWGATEASNSMASMQAHLGQWQEANNSWEEALIFAQQIGDRAKEAVFQANLGRLRMVMGQRRAAYKHLRAALQIYQSLGDIRREGETLTSMAWLALRHENLSEAISYINRARAIANRRGSRMGLAHTLWVEALIAIETEKIQQGLDLANQAHRITVQEGLTNLQINCERALGVAQMAAGMWEEAETSLYQSIELSQQLSSPYPYGLGLMALSQLCAKTSRRQEALVHLKNAIAEFEKLDAAHDLHLANLYLDNLEGADVLNAVLAQAPFSDLNGVTPSSAKATILWLQVEMPPNKDAEFVFEHVALLMPACADIVKKHGGYISQQRQFQAVFDLVSNDAVAAAHEVQSYIKGYEVFPFSFRIALTQGIVTRPSPTSPEFIARGKTLQEAQQIIAQMPSGQIWATNGIHEVGKTLFDFIPIINTDGNQTELWQLIENQPIASPLPPRQELPLIGREPILDAVYAGIADSAAEGVGKAFLVSGQDGLGKSRILRAIETRLGEQMELLTLNVECQPQDKNKPYSLIKALCRRYFAISPNDAAKTQMDKVKNAFKQLPDELKEIEPIVAAHLGLENPEGVPLKKRANPHRQNLIAFHRLFIHLASEKPLALLVDDLGWLDELSNQFLLQLAVGMARHPIFFIGAAAKRQQQPLINQLSNLLRERFVHIPLQPLTDEEGQQLLKLLMPNQEIPLQILTAIMKSCRGNPYWAFNLTLYLLEQGYLNKQGASWQPRSNLFRTLSTLPASLPALLKARLELLPPELMQTLQAGVVLGRPFSPQFLKEMTGLPQIEEKLHRLDEAFLLRGSQNSTLWRFENVTLAMTVYDMMPAVERRELHLRAAKTILRYIPKAELTQTAELARHFAKAENASQAYIYAIQMGKEAADLRANQTSLNYYRRAQKLESKIAFPDEELKWNALIGLGKLYHQMGKHNEAINVLRQAGPLASTGRLNRMRLALLYRLLGESTGWTGEYEAAFSYLESANQFLANPATADEGMEMCRLYWARSDVYLGMKNSPAALKECRQSLRLSEQFNLVEAAAQTQMQMSKIHRSIGRWKPASLHANDALNLYQEDDDWWGVANAQAGLAAIHFAQGKWDAAGSLWNQSLALTRSIGAIASIAKVEQAVGELLLHQGHLDKAFAFFSDSLLKSQAIDNAPLQILAQNKLAHALAWQSRLKEAAGIIDRALTLAEKQNDPDLTPILQITQAQIMRKSDMPAKAAELAMSAALLAADSGAKNIEGRAWLEAANAALENDQIEDAEELLVRGQEAFASLPSALDQAMVMGIAWRCLLNYGQITDAKTAYERARRAFTNLGATLYLDWLDGGKAFPTPDTGPIAQLATAG